ncbi:1-acyl-sn-glycerol-3-phosphate acyltransferase alpha-like isoform X2 [Lacerta agilis]|uniref:1-acyl-sn-glycerol-3-phosphate acyltransferase alpha-like isoform X2 n=1 Tax=Lacerta agilis TaxID=80427 RepID=UPI001419371F|nr:1-acyl-sn-glycerol-3-phosphate acyltransferase alpha-like isoform X2 [Lacerta agilis]
MLKPCVGGKLRTDLGASAEDNMAQSLGLANFFLFIFAGLLLYHYSNTFRYYFRVCFLNIWMFNMTSLVLPVIALRGRSVENMRVLRFALLPAKYFLGIKFKVQGAQNFNLKVPYVVVANQQCNVDILAMLQIMPERSTFIVKKEILHFLTVGIACWLSGFVFVDRQNRETTANSISEAADAMVRDNLRICMFPEGTGDNDSAGLLSFRHEAFLLAVEAQVPVIPVVISSYQTFFNKKIKKFTPGEVTIKILPPMKTEGLSAADVQEFADRVRETMLPIFHEISALKQEDITEEGAYQAANRQVSS